MEEIREALERLIQIKGIRSKEALILSQELDKCILDYYMSKLDVQAVRITNVAHFSDFTI